MRKIGTLISLMAAAGGCSLVGCGNSASDNTIDDAAALSFSLQGDGTVLELHGSPVDASHKATYPLAGLTKMNVKVTSAGDLTATCANADGSTNCQEMPFFAKVQRMDNGSNLVQVYDIYGNKVVDHECKPKSPDGGTPATPPSSGGSCSTGSGGSTHASDGGSCHTGGGSGSAGGGSSGDDAGAGGGYTTGGGGSGSGGGAGGSGGSGGGAGGSGGGSAGGGGGCSVDVKADCGGCTIVVGSQTCDCSDASCVKDAVTQCGGSAGGGYSTGGGGDNDGDDDGDDHNGGGYTTGGGSGSGGGTGGSGSGSGGGSGGGYTTGGGSGDDAGAGGSGGGYTTSGTCDQATIDAAKAQFCTDIDTWLKQHNITTPIDCSKVVDAHYDVKNPPAKHDDYHCRDIIASGWAKVRATLATCDASQYVNWESSSRWELLQQGDCRGSPLVLDLDGDGVNLSALDTGVSFDLLGTGDKVQTAWTRGGDAFLAIDWNKNGVIDDASELFGNASFKSEHDDGFRALGELDANGDGRIDSKDPAFNELVVWRDTDRNGVSRPVELEALRDAGVRAIDIAAQRTSGPGSWDESGNDVSLVGRFVRNDGRAGTVVDAWLRFKPLR